MCLRLKRVKSGTGDGNVDSSRAARGWRIRNLKVAATTRRLLAVGAAVVFMAQTFSFVVHALKKLQVWDAGGTQPYRNKGTLQVCTFCGDEWKADGRSSIQPRALAYQARQ